MCSYQFSHFVTCVWAFVCCVLYPISLGFGIHYKNNIVCRNHFENIAITKLKNSIGFPLWLILNGVNGLQSIQLSVICICAKSCCDKHRFYNIIVLYCTFALIFAILFNIVWTIIGSIMFWGGCNDLVPENVRVFYWYTLIIQIFGFWPNLVILYNRITNNLFSRDYKTNC